VLIALYTRYYQLNRRDLHARDLLPAQQRKRLRWFYAFAWQQIQGLRRCYRL